MKGVAGKLCAEVEASTGRFAQRLEWCGGAANRLVGYLEPEDEELVASLMASLVRIAAAVRSPTSTDTSEAAVSAALDGAELVIRGEIMMGNRRHLPTLLPSFVFLVTLPSIKEDQALDLCRLAGRVIAMSEKRSGGLRDHGAR